VDADDTLWENYRWFADVVAAWARWMEERGVAAARATATLEECEERNIPLPGYGSAPFAASLREAHEILRPDAPAAECRASREFTEWAEGTIRNHPIQLLPGVEEACAALAHRVRLVLFTKGCEDEQLAKFERSGLAPHFRGARVVAEKRIEDFLAACAEHGADPADSWMVGNSARSDVNPARRAGLRTIHVPHPAPWHRDEEPLVAAGPPTLVARNFADVPRYLRQGLLSSSKRAAAARSTAGSPVAERKRR
jgi:putative hydrolase of the HAD superfamily